MTLLQELELALKDLRGKIYAPWDSYITRIDGPRIARLLVPTGPERELCLHRLTAFDGKEPMWHWHLTAMAIKVLEGSYRMEIGFRDKGKVVSQASMEIGPGQTYMISSPSLYHRLWVPANKPVYSAVLLGDRLSPDYSRKAQPAEDMDRAEFESIRDWFDTYSKLD